MQFMHFDFLKIKCNMRQERKGDNNAYTNYTYLDIFENCSTVYLNHCTLWTKIINWLYHIYRLHKAMFVSPVFFTIPLDINT